MSPRRLAILIALALCVPAVPGRAELISLDVIRREPFAGGARFGDVGSYERITAVARFALDPADPHNRVIIDLDQAPRTAAGKVEFAADVVILAPKDLSKGNGALLYDVNNRGNKLALRFFNTPPHGNGPSAKSPAGDGFLMRRGYVVVWSGWIGELLPSKGRLLLQAPRLEGVRGPVRFEVSADSRVKSLSLSRREGHGSYPPTVAGEAKGVLTKRLRESDKRQIVPRAQWKLVRQKVSAVNEGVAGTLPHLRLEVEGGFEPGWLYELVCECEGPIVQGVGLAGVRDLIAYLRRDTGPRNPLVRAGVPVITRAHGFGVSQSGRFLRHFLWQGFNEDEKGRIVFDGLMPHVAGGGLGFFNHRFAQPNRHNGQHEDHTYPADQFPFTYGPATDPFSGRVDGLLKVYGKRQVVPRILHTQSAAEYWHRSGSLVHTTADGARDAVLPPNVRVYAFGGTQHGPAATPPGRGSAENLNNPADYRPFLRALLDALDDWVRLGTVPPPSVYPRRSSRQLVDLTNYRTTFPKIPGVRLPEVIQRPVSADRGPRFDKGILDREPPVVKGEYVVGVPSCDRDGNDVGTLNLPDVAVPLATYTGWNMRRKDVGAEESLASLLGSYLPFARTRAERIKTGDPRLSLQERYPDFLAYTQHYKAACTRLVARHLLLPEDAQALERNLERRRPLFAPAEKR